MTTDTLLAFRDKRPEAWPEGLGRTFGQSGGQCWGLSEDPCGDDVAHALIESKVMDAMAKEGCPVHISPPRNDPSVIPRGWVVNDHKGPLERGYPTRLEALIEAYKAEMKGQNTNGDD